MTTPVRHFEDLEDIAALLKRREAWLAVKWLIVLGLVAVAGHFLVTSLIASGIDPLHGAATAVLFLLLVVAFALRLLFPRLEYLQCPQCRLPLKQPQLEQAILTRACPRCAHVFASRQPPEAQAVSLDPARLPRILLEHEREPPPEAEPAPPRDPTNPYAPAPEVATAPAATAERGPRQWLALLWIATVWSLLTIFMPRRRLLAHLPPSEHPDDPQWLAFQNSYVRSQRRMAWFMAPWTIVLPTYLFVTGPLPYGWTLWKSGAVWDAVWQWGGGVLMCFAIGVVGLIVAWIGASLVLRRHFTRW